jgi:hypothetical protein
MLGGAGVFVALGPNLRLMRHMKNSLAGPSFFVLGVFDTYHLKSIVIRQPRVYY